MDYQGIKSDQFDLTTLRESCSTSKKDGYCDGDGYGGGSDDREGDYIDDREGGDGGDYVARGGDIEELIRSDAQHLPCWSSSHDCLVDGTISRTIKKHKKKV